MPSVQAASLNHQDLTSFTMLRPQEKFDYEAFNFFDDETLSEDHSPEACKNHSKWQSSVLDTGIDLTHPPVNACVEQIKGK
jgi:hypothetical protein